MASSKQGVQTGREVGGESWKEGHVMRERDKESKEGEMGMREK